MNSNILTKRAFEVKNNDGRYLVYYLKVSMDFLVFNKFLIFLKFMGFR